MLALGAKSPANKLLKWETCNIRAVSNLQSEIEDKPCIYHITPTVMLHVVPEIVDQIKMLYESNSHFTFGI
jgi:hypothetical protein